jgi:hypothetical protein
MTWRDYEYIRCYENAEEASRAAANVCRESWQRRFAIIVGNVLVVYRVGAIRVHEKKDEKQ